MNITKKNKSQPELSSQTKPFLIISANYQIETLYNILKRNPSLVNAKDQKNETFLSYAIKRRNTDVAEFILTSPVLDYSYQDQNGNSYLHLAVINQLENIIRILIQKGINVNLQNNDGNTALHFAYSTGDIKFITMIIESKIDFSIKNKNGLIAEEISPDSFPAILDISTSSSKMNNVNVTQNKNNTVTININVDNNNNNNNNDENDKNKDNNGVIINERGQINKSIKINWENNDINNNNANSNNNINLNSNNNYKLNNDDVNINTSQLENASKAKLKYSLVNFSYSDDGEGGNEVEEEEIEENGIIPNKSTSKQSTNINCTDEKKNKIKSSDIFDLTSSLSYQEKVANASFINAHIVGEPILSKKDSNEYGLNDDIVNINKIKTLENNQENSINNMINNGIDMSQVSFQTAYQNGRNMNISEINEKKENGLSVDYKNYKINKPNGQDFNLDYSKSINIEKINDNNVNIIKKESDDNNNFNANINQTSSIKIPLEFNKDFAFSPMNTLKEPLNKKSNGSINNINDINNNISNSIYMNSNNPIYVSIGESNIINTNNSNIVNINNSNSMSNININNEIQQENQIITDKNDNKEKNSIDLRRCNALIESNKNKKSNNKTIVNDLSNSKISNNNSINNIAKSAPNKSINANLSQVSQNNINTKTNSKFNFNCPVTISEDILNTSKDDPLYKFLTEIRMEKYYNIMVSNGFDDINLLINQTKAGNGIKDKQLKEAGINIPGDRVKILIRIHEKAGYYVFPIPKEVYYVCQKENIKDDININKLNDWLKSLKIENYLPNFINNGYHSIELMLLQIESKNPLTDEILKDEIGITKMGHRSRIINKLLEEGKSLKNKLKTSMLVVNNVLTEKICDCSIY